MSSGQTFNFENTGTGNKITETDALTVDAKIAGFINGDTVVLQNLGGTAAALSESVTLGNGQAIVSITNATGIVDEVTFIGNFTSKSNFRAPSRRPPTKSL